jgi:beta-glucosidase
LATDVVDEAVRRVLRIKFRAGVFERPYADAARERQTIMRPEFRTAAREIAARSMVLLKNDGNLLPLAPKAGTVAVIGSLANNLHDMMGNWTGDGQDQDVVTILDGIRAAVPGGVKVVHAPGVAIDVKTLMPGAARDARADRAGLEAAVKLARGAQAVVLVLGETGEMSGEAASRTSLDLPGRQLDLAHAIMATGRPTAVVLINGRPLSIQSLAENAPAILEAWFPGTEAGHAVADVLFGKVNPGGKLPVTFPRSAGQEPLYYNHKNTGRPPDAKDKYTSKYLDVSWTPLFPFGHGLSYTEFKLSNLRLGAAQVSPTGTLDVSVDVANLGRRAGDEVVQLYVQDVVARVTRPVQELRGFERVTLEPGETRRVDFTLGPQDLGFYDRDMTWVVEPGEFRVRVSNSSVGGVTGTFDVR